MKDSIEATPVHYSARDPQRGFSLVELMVGMVIALLGTLVIFQVFAVSEGQKRTTTSGSDAQQNGAIAMYMLERAVRTAGAGMTSTDYLLGCPLSLAGTAIAAPTVAPAPPAPILAAPVLITDGGGGNSDSITLMYGNASGLATPVTFGAAVASSATSIPVASTESAVGINNGDFVLAVDQGAVSPCSVVQVNAVPAAAGPVSIASGLGANFSASAKLINLGPIPVMAEYAVQNNALVTFDLRQAAGGNNPTIVAEGVVNIQAQYGVDTNADDVIDSWQEPTGAWAAAALTPAQIAQIKAIRLGIIVRSGQKERPDASNACTVTTAAPVALPGDATAVPPKVASPAITPFNVSTVNQDGCYRYRIFETIIPVRNMIWSSL
jgi:type IV pilus assembly protein PilW